MEYLKIKTEELGIEIIQRMETETKDFFYELLTWGSLDISHAIGKFLDYGKSGKDLAESIDNNCAQNWCQLEDIDPCFVAYDSILQEARNKIFEVLNFDICNDTNFSVDGNYSCTTWDISENDLQKLQKVISAASSEEKQDILSDIVTKKFLEEQDIKIYLKKLF